MNRILPGLTLAAVLAAVLPLAACGGDRNADCGYTGEPGSAQYERDMDRAAANGCSPDEIKPYDG